MGYLTKPNRKGDVGLDDLGIIVMLTDDNIVAYNEALVKAQSKLGIARTA